MATDQPPKPVHTLILDAGPLIKGEPSISTLLQQCEMLVTISSVISEIRDQETRARLQTTVVPFLNLRTPRPQSIKFISDFARKTGDLSVLSRTDIQLLALAYDVECERNEGDWRLRNTPGQRRTNGPPPSKSSPVDQTEGVNSTGKDAAESLPANSDQSPSDTNAVASTIPESSIQVETGTHQESTQLDTLAEDLQNLQIESNDISETEETAKDSDSEGWITPSNIKRKQNEQTNTNSSNTTEPKTMQAAMMTTDFAMQNVLLQINLNLLSPNLQRIKHIKTFILRCHACFLQVRDLSKQFCPRCGGATLTRVTCTTNAAGEFKIHLKKNMQWSNKGNRYSIPKAVHGSSNHRVVGGGKGGWGNGLILAEDQKEYVRAMEVEKRSKKVDLMDPDYLPSILTGDRSRGTARPKVGAGKTINSKKR